MISLPDFPPNNKPAQKQIQNTSAANVTVAETSVVHHKNRMDNVSQNITLRHREGASAE
jgi:hypothetical protein